MVSKMGYNLITYTLVITCDHGLSLSWIIRQNGANCCLHPKKDMQNQWVFLMSGVSGYMPEVTTH